MKLKTRRELLRMIWPKPELHLSFDEDKRRCALATRGVNTKSSHSGERVSAEGNTPLSWIKVNGSQCTGCGLCVIDCPSGAFTLCYDANQGSYQLTFNQGMCVTCGACETSCPERCLHLERNVESDRATEAPVVIFQDRVSRCRECGIPLFPQAMIDRLRARLSASGEIPWQFDFCPSCRMKALLGQKSPARRDANVQGNTSWESSSGR